MERRNPDPWPPGQANQASGEVAESIEFVRSCGAKPILSDYSLIPGTTLWAEATKLSTFDLASEPLYHNNSIFPCQWREFTRDQLNRLKIEARKPVISSACLSECNGSPPPLPVRAGSGPAPTSPTLRGGEGISEKYTSSSLAP